MSLRWPKHPQARTTIEVIADDVEELLSRLGAPIPSLTVEFTGTSEMLTLAGNHIVLNKDLLGPALYVGVDAAHRESNPVVALDRFRRCTGLIVEGVLLNNLAAETEIPVEAVRDAWWAVGSIAEAIDTAAPALGWILPELSGLLQEPMTSVSLAPRRAAWWFRYLDQQQARPADLSRVEARHWAEFGRWLRDRGSGPRATTTVDLSASPPMEVGELPTTAASMSHVVVSLPGGQNGAHWRCSGGAQAGQWAVQGGRTGVGVIGVVTPEPLSVSETPIGPVGSWRLAAGHFGARVGSARGIELELTPQGSATLTGADAFVGPPTAHSLALADKFGVSGTATGSWALTAVEPDGATGQLTVAGIDGDASVHPRASHGFALPAEEWLQPVRAVLKMLEAEPIRWTVASSGQRLQLHVLLQGTEMAFEFERAN